MLVQDVLFAKLAETVLEDFELVAFVERHEVHVQEIVLVGNVLEKRTTKWHRALPITRLKISTYAHFLVENSAKQLELELGVHALAQVELGLFAFEKEDNEEIVVKVVGSFGNERAECISNARHPHKRMMDALDASDPSETTERKVSILLVTVLARIR